MRIIGLTGSIGMGKSETAKLFKRLHVPVFEADYYVHALLGPGGRAVAEIEKLAPDCVKDGAVDRAALGAKTFADPKFRKALEAIMHPLVRAAEERFIRHHRIHRTPIIVLDIPLLFETGAEKLCDAVVVVTATHFIQAQRVLARPGMTQERFAAILKAQMPDAAKRARADFIIHTGLGKREALCQIKRLLCPSYAK